MMTPDLETVLDDTLARLARAARDRRAPFRTPVMATADAASGPRARTVVLRAVQRAPLCVDVYTDARSGKARQLGHDPRAELCFWDRGASLQVRLRGEVSRHRDDGPAAAARARLPESARVDYDRARAPGEVAGDPDEAAILEAGPFAHFLLLRLAAREIDWLELGREGHRRALFTCTEGPWQGAWTVP